VTDFVRELHLVQSKVKLGDQDAAMGTSLSAKQVWDNDGMKVR